MGTKNIEAFRLSTRIEVDNAKGRVALQQIEKDTDKVGQRFTKLGPEITKALKGTEAGGRFGRDFGASAVSSITGSIKSLGQTLGSLIGTSIAPGIGTAIGSTIGSAVDATLGKISGPLLETIQQGIELNKELERTTVEFKTFAGTEQEATKYLADLKKLAIDSGTDFRFLLDASEHTFDLTSNLKLTNTILRAATDQAADFGGKAETIGLIAEQLGLIAEKGDLASRELMKLYKLGIDAKKYLSQATGLTEKNIERMIAQGRIRGDVAARLIAEGIEREKGGFAAKIATTTTYGAEARANVQEQLLGARGTENITKAIGDYNRLKAQILGSSQAQDVVGFIDKSAGQLINLVEKGLSSGYNLTRGIAEGVMSGDAQAMLKSSFSSLGGFVESTLKGVFGIESPSTLTRDKVGIPIGQGIGVGTGIGMDIYAQDHAEDDVKRFIARYTEAAIKAMKETGVPASVTLAQAILESGVGKSGLTQKANNFFGIKGSGPAGSVTMRTREETKSGQSYYVNSPFRAYNSADESFMDHARFLQGPRYRGALQNAGDPKRYARDIAGAGYATDRNYAQKLGSTIDKFGLARLDTMVEGSPVSVTHPMPVAIVATTGRGGLEGAGYSKEVLDFLYSSGPSKGSTAAATQTQTVTLGDADAAVVNINTHTEELVSTTNSLVNTGALMLRPLQAVQYNAGMAAASVDNLSATAKSEFEATEKYKEAAKKALFQSVDITSQLSGMLSQAAGFLPQQEVGKKRGLFSKILGFAAPFLSFIPGAGPILSQLASIGSNALAGNWSGAVSGVASGLQSGGVFRGSGTPASGTGATRARTVTKRAGGGPVSRGRGYLIGEYRPEIFEPQSDGWIHPNAGGEQAALFARMAAALERLEAVSPGHVLAQGARERPDAIGSGLTRAYDRDARLLRDHGRRHRFN